MSRFRNVAGFAWLTVSADEQIGDSMDYRPDFTRRLVLILFLIIVIAAGARMAGAQAAGRGTIKGHIRLNGKLPGNPVIRMGVDPMCAKINAGKRVIQETVVASLDGSLANAFVYLSGTFPSTPVPSEPVTLDQQSCIYRPRVIGLRVGQTLQVKNSDALLHNVHGISVHPEGSFNVGQPVAGMVNKFTLKNEEIMFQLKCDVHRWMIAYIGVVNHPYFAVSDTAGTFEIRNVPAGMQTIKVWHEHYGTLTQTLSVKGGAIQSVEFAYAGE